MLIGPFKQIVTMDQLPVGGALKDDQLQVVEQGGILIEGDTIKEVGVFEELRTKSQDVVEVSKDAVALPGFIDCHTHICFAGSRAGDYALRLSGATYQEIAARGGGILDTVKRTREATKEELIDSIVERSRALLKAGVTTAEVKSGYGLSAGDEIKMLEAINDSKLRAAVDLVPTCLAAHTLPWEFKERKEYLDYILNEILPVVKKRSLSDRVDIFVEKGAFWLEDSKDYLEKAKALGFNITIHADQFTSGGSQLACEVGAVSADHLEASTDEDYERMRGTDVTPVVLPGASLGLGIPFAKARKALDKGLPLAIASDWNPGSAPMGDLLTQAALLGAYEKLTLAETLAGITSRAAHALRLSDRGRLAAGCKAHMTVFDCGDYREILYHQGSLKPAQTRIERTKNETIRS